MDKNIKYKEQSIPIIVSSNNEVVELTRYTNLMHSRIVGMYLSCPIGNLFPLSYATIGVEIGGVKIIPDNFPVYPIMYDRNTKIFDDPKDFILPLNEKAAGNEVKVTFTDPTYANTYSSISFPYTVYLVLITTEDDITEITTRNRYQVIEKSVTKGNSILMTGKTDLDADLVKHAFWFPNVQVDSTHAIYQILGEINLKIGGEEIFPKGFNTKIISMSEYYVSWKKKKIDLDLPAKGSSVEVNYTDATTATGAITYNSQLILMNEEIIKP